MKKTRRNGIVIMFRLFGLIGNLSLFMVLAILNGLLGNLMAFAVPTLGALAVVKALGEDIILSYGAIIAILVSCGVLRGILRYLEQYSNHFIAFKILAILRDRVFKALRRLGPAKVEEKEKGGLLSLVTSDIETLEVFYAHTLSPIAIAILFSLVVFLLVGFLSSFVLALVALLGYLLVGILLPVLSSKLLKDVGVDYRKEFASFGSYFLDSIKGIREVLLYGKGQERGKENDRRTDSLLSQTRRLKDRTAFFMLTTEFVVTLVFSLAVMVSFFLVQEGLPLPRAVLGMVMILSSFGPVLAIANLPANLTQTFASGDRLLDLVDEKGEIEDVIDGKDFAFDSLRVENLVFSYEDGKKILDGDFFHVEKGEIVGIKGESGEGKSTLLKLLLGFVKKEEGQIEYSGIPIEEINTKSLRDNVTMVSQTTYLFNGTIEDNLRIARQDSTPEEMIQALEEASLSDFVKEREKGLRTSVGEMGRLLSAGERQRLGLARAFLRKAPLVLLDEPTSNVDGINEGIILSSILKKKKDHAFLLVSHRSSTLAICDRVYVLKDGRMMEETKE